MGTLIDRVELAEGGWRSRHSGLRLATKSATDCLARAGRRPQDVDLLVNAGVYRDRNLGEPALAAMIQEDIGANPEDPHDDAHGTFSFDVANGSCGVLTALQIVDGFFKSGAIDCALVVASDADPGHHMSVAFPFAPAGAALLCGWDDDDRGLGRVYWSSIPDRGESFNATVGMIDRRNILRFHQSADLDQRLAAAAAEAVAECLTASSLRVEDLDAIIAAPARSGFRSQLAERLEIGEQLITVAEDQRMHTASLAAAFERGTREVRPGGLILLIAAAAGVTAGAALYRLPQ
jgi:3-oxoacyl-[acyl-carrier-protein] synthase-3